MNTRLKMLHEVALVADGPAFTSRARELGGLAATALGEKHRSQITGLESLANSTLKVSDVFDYLKLRTARHKEWRESELGQQLLQYLEQDLAQEREQICLRLGLSDEAPEQREQRQEVYRALIRAFVQQLAAHYEYALALPEGASQ